MSDKKSLKQVVSNTYKNPATKALVTLIEDIPIAGSIIGASREAIEQSITNIQESRKAVFFDELEKGGLITVEMLDKEDFIHSFVVVYRAAINTYSRDKIRRFACILLTAIEEDELASDKFEEYSKILENITERELWLLSELRRLEMKWISQNDKQHSKSEFVFMNAYGVWATKVTINVWQEFTKQTINNYKSDYHILQNTLKKLEGIGLYSGTAAHIYIKNDSHDIGTTTHLFEQFVKWIQLESEQDEVT